MVVICKTLDMMTFGQFPKELALDILIQGIVITERRQKKRCEDNIREWTGLELRNTLRKDEDREEWKAVVWRSSAAPRRIPNLRDR